MRLLRRRAGERGSMAVEVVLMTPILVLFTLLVVAGGRYVTVRADIESAARDAARAASLERSEPAAQQAATQVATAALGSYSDCVVKNLDGRFVSGSAIEVTLDCQVDNNGLGLLGLSGVYRISASGAAPIDTYRRTG